ncbi:MAG TPA: DUF3775 domain-containing protein [Gammaproteobacteria bacterium]
MSDLNPEIVRLIIDRARKFQVKEQMASPEDPDPGDWSRKALGSYEDDPSFQELKTAIQDLEPDQQVRLVALMWVGRGDFAADEWPVALKRAEESWNDRTAEYLIGTPLLADYLADGLDQIDIDQL